MKRAVSIAFAALCVLLLSGCYDQMVLEDVSLSLMIGLDVDDSNKLVIFQQSPVFYKEAIEKSENASVTATSVRQSREKLDAVLTGLTAGGKNQTLLIGKRLLAQKDWYALIDLFYRDPKQSSTQHVILVDGPVADIFYFKPKNKPRLSLHMNRLITTANRRNITVDTKLYELRRQMKDKGLTPSLALLKKDTDKIEITGTALLDKQGKLAADLALPESTLLLILQNRAKGTELPFAIDDVQPASEHDDSPRVVTFNANLTKMQIKIGYAKHTFQYDVTMKFDVQLTSFNYEDHATLQDRKPQLEDKIAAELRNKFEALIKKCQSKEIDPFGFGLYARAYQYPAWKTVQNEWGKAFAKATVRVSPQVRIKSFGVTE